MTAMTAMTAMASELGFWCKTATAIVTAFAVTATAIAPSAPDLAVNRS